MKRASSDGRPANYIRRREQVSERRSDSDNVRGPAEMTRAIGAVPALVVLDIEASIRFYESAFAATDFERHYIPDGSLVYASFMLGNARIGVTVEDGRWNRSPHSLGGSPVPIDLEVDDADAFIDQARNAGAEILIAVADHAYGRSGRIVDPFGHVWIITSNRSEAR
ncbi:MAG: VOC family protein [Chloroflexota bacterium]|nr:MAG: VOC family protein [Chloroflexota bacterium]